jgi:glycosyltransferase involved in cell wall biosynthesis
MTGRAKNRIAWAGAWHYAHNNRRYEELLPRLTNVDRYSVRLHPFWLLRGLERRVWLPLLTRSLGIRYPLFFSTDWRQIRMLRCRVVCDFDDPVFSAPEIAALNLPNVAAVVVTSDLVRRKMREAGVRASIEVVPQGVAAGRVDPQRVGAIRRKYSAAAEDVVVGLHQPHFEYASELPSGSVEQMYAVDLLMETMSLARGRNPRLVLWLVGEPSERVREVADRNPWIRLPGYQPRSELMEYVSAFDIGVYPRTSDLKGRSSIKLVEYMACGVPVVGFDVEEMRLASEAGAGIAVQGVSEFAEALTSLAEDPGRRKQMGERGKKTARLYHWDSLSQTYRALLDGLSNSARGKEGGPA